MASRAPTADNAIPLDVLLASVPSLPRALLSRLTARMISRLGEPDDEGAPEPTGDQPDHKMRLQRIRYGRADEAQTARIRLGSDLYRRPPVRL